MTIYTLPCAVSCGNGSSNASIMDGVPAAEDARRGPVLLAPRGPACARSLCQNSAIRSSVPVHTIAASSGRLSPRPCDRQCRRRQPEFILRAIAGRTVTAGTTWHTSDANNAAARRHPGTPSTAAPAMAAMSCSARGASIRGLPSPLDSPILRTCGLTPSG